MTIHSDWARLLKEECPEAFSVNTPRHKYGVGVIDGHLQLMCLHGKLPSWDAFVKYLFLKPINKLFEAGCPKVVLCFDCYDNVPAYKNMTQLKRAKGFKVCVFDARQDLPSFIPEDAMLYLMNRDFKKKVIDMVCDKLPQMLQLKAGQELLVDYKRVIKYSGDNCQEASPLLFGGGGSEVKKLIPTIVHDLAPMGESDVKFARYVDLYGSALVHAIDGDYLIIALLYYCTHGIMPDNKIFIFRQMSSLDKKIAPKKSSSSAPASKKSKIKHDDDDDYGHADGDKKRVVVVVNSKNKKEGGGPPKCWVDMQLLYLTISQCMWQGARGDVKPINVKTGRPFSDKDAVHSAILLMLCAGTDFSRPLPLVGPKRIWDNLPWFSHSLLQSAPWDEDLDESLFLDGVIAKLYANVFEKHVHPSCSDGGNMGKVLG